MDGAAPDAQGKQTAEHQTTALLITSLCTYGAWIGIYYLILNKEFVSAGHLSKTKGTRYRNENSSWNTFI